MLEASTKKDARGRRQPCFPRYNLRQANKFQAYWTKLRTTGKKDTKATLRKPGDDK